MKNKVIHHNYWHWGESYIIILNNGLGTATLQISDSNHKCGVISSLSVVKNVRKHGIGNQLLHECETLAFELGLEELCLYAEKNTFTREWYERHGYKKDNYRNTYLYRLTKTL